MQLTAIILAGIATIAAANPVAANEPRNDGVSSTGPLDDYVSSAVHGSNLCPDSETPQCCQISVLNLAVLGCNDVSSDIKTKSKFKNHCEKDGAKAKCCNIPVLGQALICQDVK